EPGVGLTLSPLSSPVVTKTVDGRCRSSRTAKPARGRRRQEADWRRDGTVTRSNWLSRYLKTSIGNLPAVEIRGGFLAGADSAPARGSSSSQAGQLVRSDRVRPVFLNSCMQESGSVALRGLIDRLRQGPPGAAGITQTGVHPAAPAGRTGRHRVPTV